MKKSALAFILALTMIFSLVGCAPTEKAPVAATDSVETSQPSGEPSKLDYPNGPITWIVPYSAGGGTDLAVRTFIKYLEPLVGETIVVSNKEGGGGTIGVTELFHSKPDGSTMGTVTLASQVISRHQLDLEYTMEDFEYIGSYAQWSYGVAVNADSPFKSIEDVIEAGKKEGGLQYGAAGTVNGFVMDDLGKATDSNLELVFYGNTTDCTTDCLGGFVPCIVADIASHSSYVKSGQMRLLASGSDKRWPCAPDVPTLQELGYDVAQASYTGLAFPADTDPEIVAFMRECFDKVCADEAFQKELYDICSLTPIALNGDDYYKLLQSLEKDYEPRFKK